MRPRTRRDLQATFLGALHGPAELLPISSSGHLTLVPWLLGWKDWDRRALDPELRKAFEVALHAGTAAALVIALRDEVGGTIRALNVRSAGLMAATFAPPAVAGLALEGVVEQRLGTPGTIAAGLALGSVALVWADIAPQRRDFQEAGFADAVWLGVGQACALLPGVSRNGAALVAARRRRFTRAGASRLSRHAALPVIAGATALKGVRIWRRGLPPGDRRPFAAGALAAFASTLAAARLIPLIERDRPLAPYAAYRLGLAGAVAWRLWDERQSGR